MLRRIFEKILGKAKPDPDFHPAELEAEHVIDRINANSRLCVRTVRSDKASRSKLGGVPTVPAEFDWPVWNGTPLQFLCQLDLAQAQSALPSDWLPDSGLLSFFYIEEQSNWGFDPADRGSWRVLHFPVDAELISATVPQGLNTAAVLPEVFLSFEKADSLPAPERVGLQYSQIADEVWAYLDQKNFPANAMHQIGGWPVAIQNDNMETECQLASNGVYVGGSEGYYSDEGKRLADGSGEWRLLFQLDSDDDAQMFWGDMGRLYFWVKETQSVQGDFSGVWMILQCS